SERPTMRPRALVPWLLPAALLCVTPLLRGEDKPDPRVYEASAKIEGKTYAQWSAAWWQWVMGIKKDRNPVLDKTGALAAERQTEKVWFLAGNVGGKTTRKCTVPAGKPLFFPIVNWCEDAEPDKADEKKLRAIVKAEMGRVEGLKATLDGKP